MGLGLGFAGGEERERGGGREIRFTQLRCVMCSISFFCFLQFFYFFESGSGMVEGGVYRWKGFEFF